MFLPFQIHEVMKKNAVEGDQRYYDQQILGQHADVGFNNFASRYCA